MPIDFASGFNFGGYDPSGFAGRAAGGYFPSVYGYNNQGQAVNDRNQMSQINAQQMNPAPATTPSQMSGPDFFSALAGLMGGGNPYGQQTAPAQGPQVNQYSSQWSPGQAVNAGNMQSYAHQQGPVTGYGYSGGQGPYGGVNPEVQRAMFESGNQMSRNGQIPSGNPLRSLPTIVSNHRNGGSSSFAPSTSVGSVSGRNNAPVGTMRAPTRVVNQNPYTPTNPQTPYGLPAGYSHGVRF
jgi:hypothetical protein